MSQYDENNIFAKILRGEIPCNKVYEDTQTLAFTDISPVAPIHVLVIPKGPYMSQADFVEKAPQEEIVKFYKTLSLIASQQGLLEGGYRTVANTGPHAGEIPHFHVHILGGEPLGPIRVK